MAQVLPSTPRVDASSGRRLTWPAVAVLLLAAGLLSGASWVVRWWGVCLPDALDSAACALRQSSEMSITSALPGLPADLRVAAVLLAISQLVVALLWFVLPVVATGRVWLRWLTALGGLYPLSVGVVALTWHGKGRLVEVSPAVTVVPAIVGFIALVYVSARALGESRRADCLLAVGILSTTLPAVVVDWSFWSALTAPWDYPPGFGSAAPGGLLGAGTALLAYSLRHHHGHGWVRDPLLTLPPVRLVFAPDPMRDPYSRTYRPADRPRR